MRASASRRGFAHCFFFALPVAVLLCRAALLFGQDAPSEASVTDIPEPPPLEFDPVQRGLEATPLSVEALGLTIHLPIGARVSQERIAGRTNLSIQDGTDPPVWSVLVQQVAVVPEAPSTPEGQVSEHLRRLVDAGMSHELLSNEPVTYRGSSGQLCYVSQSASDGRSVVTGWLVIPRGPTELLIFSILFRPEQREQVTALLENSFQTMVIVDEELIAARRRNHLLAGQTLLASLTEERLRGLVGYRQVFRLYRAAEPGSTSPEQELGYSLIEVTEAQKGALNPDRQENDYDASEHELGLLVKVQGRAVIDLATGAYYDSLGLYWLSWDQLTESWSVRATFRQKDRERSESETGFRDRPNSGDPVPRLIVIRATSRSLQRRPYEWAVPSVYMSQALTWIIDQLVLQEPPQRQELTFACYTFSVASGEPSMPLWEQSITALDEGRGGWEMRTRLGSAQEATISRYDARGSMLFRERSDGTITRPIDAGELRRIWQRAGLQLGQSER